MPNGKGNVTQRMEYRRNYPKEEKVAWKSESASKSKAPKPLKSMK
jgi:hypothetical protein